MGIGGMVGAGRTELIEGLMGFVRPEAESIVLNGREIGNRSVRTLMDRRPGLP